MTHNYSFPASIFAKHTQIPHDSICCPFWQLNRSTVQTGHNFLYSVQYKIPSLIITTKIYPKILYNTASCSTEIVTTYCQKAATC